MNTDVIEYMENNGFEAYKSDEQSPDFVKLFEMCPTCKNLWCLCIRSNGEWEVSNEFGITCWKNGYNVIHQGFESRIIFPPWLDENSIPERVETSRDVKVLIMFVESYQHKL